MGWEGSFVLGSLIPFVILCALCVFVVNGL
jgi:hypothetical protein